MEDKILIEGLEVFGCNGTFESEKVLGQTFIIDMEIVPKVSFSKIEDDLNNTVDYSEVVKFVREYFQNSKSNLLESICNNISLEIFKKFCNVNSFKISIFKSGKHITVGFNGMKVVCKRSIHGVYIALGSNLGNRKENIENAIEMMNNNNIRVIKSSSIIETEPYGGVEQDDFLNSVVFCETVLSPRELIDRLLLIERDLKRERIINWGPRTIDLDILIYDEKVINEEDLVIPHYDMQNRYFVLKPLCELNKFCYNKRLGKFAYEMLNELEK